jgi:hypothetical protein
MKKLAIKVENEREYNALMKDYESKGWKWSSGCDPLEMDYMDFGLKNKIIEFKNNFIYDISDKIYEVISFKAYATLTGFNYSDEIVIEGAYGKYTVKKDGVLFHKSESCITASDLTLIMEAFNSLKQ